MKKVSLLLHNIRSVYNTAAIFRVADCLGVDEIFISGYTPAPVDRFGRWRSDFSKVALGTERTQKWKQIEGSVSSELNKLRKEGYELVALEQGDCSLDLRSYQVSGKIVLIPGTETTGVESQLLDMADTVLEIAQVGTKESLNLHAATSIALWHLLQ